MLLMLLLPCTFQGEGCGLSTPWKRDAPSQSFPKTRGQSPWLLVMVLERFPVKETGKILFPCKRVPAVGFIMESRAGLCWVAWGETGWESWACSAGEGKAPETSDPLPVPEEDPRELERGFSQGLWCCDRQRWHSTAAKQFPAFLPCSSPSPAAQTSS